MAGAVPEPKSGEATWTKSDHTPLCSYNSLVLEHFGLPSHVSPGKEAKLVTYKGWEPVDEDVENNFILLFVL